MKSREADTIATPPEGVRVVHRIEEHSAYVALQAELERVKSEAFAHAERDRNMIAERDRVHLAQRLEWQDRVLALQHHVVALQDRLLAIRSQAMEPL